MKYCKIINNIVVDTIISTQDFINSGAVGDPSQWIFSEHEGFIGDTYDSIENKFIPRTPDPEAVEFTKKMIEEVTANSFGVFLPNKPLDQYYSELLQLKIKKQIT